MQAFAYLEHVSSKGKLEKYTLDVLEHIELDKIRDIRTSKDCSLRNLDLLKCLSNELKFASEGFVLDIGGDSVFRLGVDNKDRLNQIIDLKKTYSGRLVVLTANRNVLLERYINTKSKGIGNSLQNEMYFQSLWSNWLNVEKRLWEKCADFFIDTTSLGTKQVVNKIVKIMA